MFQHFPDVVEAFERSHRSGSHSDHPAVGTAQLIDEVAAHRDIFGVHLVPFESFAFYRFECTGSHV